jgi:hypothetical protein
MDRISYGKPRLYQGMLIQYQSYHDDYASPHGRVAISDGDGMTSITQVLVVRCTWLPVVVSCHAMN